MVEYEIEWSWTLLAWCSSEGKSNYGNEKLWIRREWEAMNQKENYIVDNRLGASETNKNLPKREKDAIVSHIFCRRHVIFSAVWLQVDII